MSTIAPPPVVVDRVHKRFEMPREQVSTLKERALHPLRRSITDTLHALRGISFAVEPGEFFGIVGRNGSGKSTLLKCLAGIYGVDSGSIYINGRMSHVHRARRRLQPRPARARQRAAQRHDARPQPARGAASASTA